MPNRVLRDWTDSEPVNTLDAWAERTFARLIMKVDDYGRQRGETKLLRPLLYPLLLDQVREADLQRQLQQVEQAGLVRFYDVEGKRYLEVLNFRQRLRNPKSKHPPPPGSTAGAGPPDDRHLTDNGRSNGSHPRAESESNAQSPPKPPPQAGGGRNGGRARRPGRRGMTKAERATVDHAELVERAKNLP